jgi:hypothetical protein
VIRPGEDWGSPTTAEPDAEISGDDAALALAVTQSPGSLFRFHPSSTSDLARAIGAQTAGTTGVELALDALEVVNHGLACNMIVLGVPPDRVRRFSRRIPVTVTVDGKPWLQTRATTVVVATGEFRHGADLVPRGHPGDARIEVQVYAPAPRDRANLRARLKSGTHVPHPQIAQRACRTVTVQWAATRALELDGHRSGGAIETTISVVPGAYRLLV